MFFSLFKNGAVKRIIQTGCYIVCYLAVYVYCRRRALLYIRAAVMFTFILAGKMLNKNGNIYNTLAASAFILLITNPFYLWDVGFQLSYAAVCKHCYIL
jgi:competence protein ComEC